MDRSRCSRSSRRAPRRGAHRPVDRRAHRPACRRSTATSRSTGTSAPDRCSSRSRASTPSSCSHSASRPASGRTTSASIAAPAAARASSRSSASARACCWCSRTSRSDRAAPTRSSASRSRTRSRSRCCGASPSPPRATAACSSTRTDFLLRDLTGAGSALRPGNYRVDRTRSAFYLPRTKAFPKNTEIEMTLTFVNDAARRTRRRRRPGRSRVRRRSAKAAAAAAVGGGGRGGGLFSGSVASVTPTADAVTMREHVVVRRAARRQLQAARRRSARRLRRPDLRRLQHADRRADADALHPSPSSGEEGSERGDQRAGEADSVLGRLGRARGREEGAGRRRELVEPGVRSRRLPQRVQGRRAARRRRPDGHPLQHDQLGPPLDARLELRRIGVRSAHRRDHQGDGDARLAARSPGLHDLRRPALAVRDRQREARRCSTRRR